MQSSEWGDNEIILTSLFRRVQTRCIWCGHICFLLSMAYFEFPYYNVEDDGGQLVMLAAKTCNKLKLLKVKMRFQSRPQNFAIKDLKTLD